jgi:transposase-like protein
MVAIACPHCGQTKPVNRHGTNPSGSSRCFCRACKKAFTLDPKPTRLTEEKRALIERYVLERTSGYPRAGGGICRAVGCSPNTVYAVLQKK